ncbi:MAG TPA: hypothetical protein VFR42_12070 [Candidatus Acidoferrum sp.]|nr:hypothetical protein [Candidatus Acidoferrum sp.]
MRHRRGDVSRGACRCRDRATLVIGEVRELSARFGGRISSRLVAMHGYAADAVHTWFHGGTVYSTTPRNWGSGRRPYRRPAAIRPAIGLGQAGGLWGPKTVVT